MRPWLCLALVGLLAGCESGSSRRSAPPRERAGSESHPATTTPDPSPPASVRDDVEVAPRSEPATPPQTVAARPLPHSAEPADTAEGAAHDPEPTDGAAPAYLRVLERVVSSRAFSVRATVRNDRRIDIVTDNVQRLALDRSAAGLQRDESVVLRIDEQSFEWTPRFDRLEMARSPSGIWEVVQGR